eukprot:gene999-125_t
MERCLNSNAEAKEPVCKTCTNQPGLARRVNNITQHLIGQTKVNDCAAKTEYTWQDVHKDLEAGKYAGVYGWDNAAYWGLAEHRAGVDLHDFYKKRTADEVFLPEWEKLLRDPATQESTLSLCLGVYGQNEYHFAVLLRPMAAIQMHEATCAHKSLSPSKPHCKPKLRRLHGAWMFSSPCWKNIVMFDPMGMFAFPPSIAACRAKLTIPEMSTLHKDGKIVTKNGDIVTSKASVYYSWNIPGLAERLNMTEADLRQSLFKYSKDKDVLRDDIRTYIPAVGGFTIYCFGDLLKLRQTETEAHCSRRANEEVLGAQASFSRSQREIANKRLPWRQVTVRVHDECIGSDVFGSDICTCRPYLIYALQHAVETAQRGGVGLVVYFRKEGRSLGEVVKFRVYNARGNQQGGDTAEKYFHQTESIAGIRDARFQEMMPDALHWIGVKRIDYLMSMSNERNNGRGRAVLPYFAGNFRCFACTFFCHLFTLSFTLYFC